MAEESLITEEMKKVVGVVQEPIIWEVERGAIKRFAEAVGDPNPLYFDEEYAKGTRYGGIVAPPGFWGWRVKAPLSWNRRLSKSFS